jgi:hypothetical protein
LKRRERGDTPDDSLLESDVLTHCYFFIAKIQVDMGMTLRRVPALSARFGNFGTIFGAFLRLKF